MITKQQYGEYLISTPINDTGTNLAKHVAGVSYAAITDSLRAGRLIVHDQIQTIADGIAGRIPIPQALEDMQGLVDDTVLVKEESILKAMRLLHQQSGIVVEPSAAVGVAALLEQPDVFCGKTVGTIICGGNLTAEQMRAWFCEC
jgi:threonine dehydratase